MPYLKKIVGFFVVSVFPMFSCLASSNLPPDASGLNDGPRVPCCQVTSPREQVTCSQAQRVPGPTDSNVQEMSFSPHYKTIAPVTIPQGVSRTQRPLTVTPLTVTMHNPVIPVTPKVEINSPVTILLSPSNGHEIVEDDAILAASEAQRPILKAAANGASVLVDADDSSATDSPIESIAYLFGTPREGSPSRMRIPTIFPGALRKDHKRRLSTDCPLICQTQIDRGASSMPSSLPPSPMMRTKLSIELPEDVSDVPTQDTKLILSIDGGGSRGIIPLEYLVELQDAIGQPLKFDMIAGTSVGAMIGAAVAMDQLPDMHDNFQDYVNRIFVKNWFSFGGLWRPTYSSEGRLQCIDEIVHDMNGRDLDTPFIAPFYSLLTREAHVYRNYGNGDEFKLKDVLMMSSAAPTYFNPHNCRSERGTAYEGIDGGVFANHPGHIAYQEAKQLFPNSRICMLSLGTGMHNSCDGTNQSRNRGLIYWGEAFSEIAIDATSFLSNSALVDLAQTDPNFEYVRIQPSLEKSCMVTDGTSSEHIKKLAAAVRRSIGTGGSEHDRFQVAQDMLTRHYDGDDSEEMSD